MPWWPFANSGNQSSTENEVDKFVPPPPVGGTTVPLPGPPRAMNLPSPETQGFSPPPPTSYSGSQPSLTFQTSGDAYEQDYSKYTSPVRESSGIDDQFYTTSKNSILDRLITNPRARNCVENIKLGMKMGGLVGGIFGGLTGCYAAVAHRNLLILPVSVIGGGISFGFFLGCGMAVRCESPGRQTPEYFVKPSTMYKRAW